jgi:hypothetical protein
MRTVVFKSGDVEISFYPEINAKKTFKEFAKHEAHHGLTEDQLKEAHNLCKQIAGSKEPSKEVIAGDPGEQVAQ